MGKPYRKQHIIPKTYLKHFSLCNDGKSLSVMDLSENRTPNIRSVASGNRLFWQEDYYDSIRFKDRKTIEKSFSKLIENVYDTIIERISIETPISEQWIKDELRIFIFFAVYRSPAFRHAVEMEVEFESWLSKVYPSPGTFLNVEEIDRKFVCKELHLAVWSDQSQLEQRINDVLVYLGIKEWEILIAPEGKFWLTSDDPCVEYKFGKELNNFVPTKIWDFKTLDSMFVPLTKKYCLHIFPYSQNDDTNINLDDVVIPFRIVSAEQLMLFNKFSFLMMHRILIGPDQKSHEDVLRYVFASTT